jgi:hypothetical protein
MKLKQSRPVFLRAIPSRRPRVGRIGGDAYDNAMAESFVDASRPS